MWLTEGEKVTKKIKSGWDTGWNTSSIDWDILHGLRNRRGGTCDKFRWNKLCLSCLKIHIWQCPLVITHVSLELRRAMLTWNFLEGQSRQMAAGALMVEKLTEEQVWTVQKGLLRNIDMWKGSQRTEQKGLWWAGSEAETKPYVRGFWEGRTWNTEERPKAGEFNTVI